jgi:hypothetical protein
MWTHFVKANSKKLKKGATTAKGYTKVQLKKQDKKLPQNSVPV